MSIHNEAKYDEIAKIVLMPGDPLRAKYIAENFLEDYKLVNQIRNIFAYTGYYKGNKVTVMASGMGMPSMGIYCYELYKYYDVETIIRIGSCGTYSEDIELLDLILVDESFTLGNFAEQMSGEKCNCVTAKKSLNDIIEYVAKNDDIKLIKSNVVCTECMEMYMVDSKKFIEKLPNEKNITCSEMESFALFYTAKILNKNAACLLSVVDSNCKDTHVSSEDRQLSLNNMIKVALDTAVTLYNGK